MKRRRISLDCIRVAMLSERGGLIMNSLIGVAITGVGVANLHKDVAELNGQQAREIGKVLRELEEQLETADEVIQRDHLWCRIAFGWARPVGCIGRRTFQQHRARIRSDEESSSATIGRAATFVDGAGPTSIPTGASIASGLARPARAGVFAEGSHGSM